jgi:hypothetical protein
LSCSNAIPINDLDVPSGLAFIFFLKGCGVYVVVRVEPLLLETHKPKTVVIKPLDCLSKFGKIAAFGVMEKHRKRV